MKQGWLAPVSCEEAISTGRLSRRFAVLQSSKVRCVDNYCESQVNDAVTVMCKGAVDGVETVAVMMAESLRALKDHGKSSSLRARSFDLKSAYRQLAISQESLPWARICVFNMPFGGRALVVAFIRCARAIQWLARWIYIILSCYYDDYMNVSPEDRAKTSEEAFVMLLDLLGWRYDKDGSKSDSMSDQVSSLGASSIFKNRAKASSRFPTPRTAGPRSWRALSRSCVLGS